MEHTSTNTEHYVRIAALVMAILIGIAFCVTLVLYRSPDPVGSDTIRAVNDGWRLSGAGDFRVVSLPVKVPAKEDSVISFTRTCTPEELSRGILMINNERQYMTVCVNGEEVYRLDAINDRLPTSIYEYCMVRLRPYTGPAEITVTFSRFRETECVFKEAYLASPAEVFTHVVLKDAVQAVVLVVCLVLMICVGLLDLWLLLNGQNNPRFHSLFFLMASVSLWVISNTWTLPLVLGNQAVSWMIYTSLMALPIPVGLFAYYSTVNYRSRFLLRAVLISIIVAIIEQLFYLLGIAPLYDMSAVVHLGYALVSVAALQTQIKDYRLVPSTHSTLMILIFTIPVLLTAMVIPMFWLMEGQAYMGVYLAGMMLFNILLVIDAIVSLVARHMDARKAEAELMLLQTLSYNDALTGLGNRRAFDEHLDRIERSRPNNALLMFMDMNGLKCANDKYGHAAGDELIRAACNCIQKVFGSDGICYRLGGDEFAAVIENHDRRPEDYAADLDAAILEYNRSRKIPLSIARGFEELVSKDGIRRTLSLWKSNADREMYADKVRTKMLLTRNDTALVTPEYIDGMAGILNTEGFRQNAVRLLCANADKPYSLWYYDIKRFKFVNDFFGYEMGDKLIQYISSLLLESIGVGETCGRISGDCFVGLYQFADEAAMNDHFSYISGHLNNFLDTTKVTYQLEIGAGVYKLKPEDMKVPDINQMMDWANVAQKSIKNLRGSQYVLFGEQMWQRQWRDLYINQTLDDGIRNRDISVWFQPQYDFTTGRIIGAEALCRWTHTSLGWISPGEFIPALEHTGQISRLDAFVREEVCRLMQRWRSSTTMEPISVSVNISRNSVMEEHYVAELDELLARYKLPHSALRLEITESAYMEHPEMLVDAVNLLHAHGYTVEMDDFGSGYSSLNMLKDVPVDLVKLDIRFLQGQTQRSKGAQIINAVVRMARDLNITVLTEGVEDLSQAQYLANIGCPLMQGYFFAKPLPLNEFETLLRAEKTRMDEIRNEAPVPSAWFGSPVPEDAVGEVYDVFCADYQINTAGQVVYCGSGFTRLTGYTWEDVIACKLTQNDLIPETDRPAYWRMLQQRLSVQSMTCIKHRIRRKDGKTLMVHCLGEPMMDEYTGESRNAIHLQCDARELDGIPEPEPYELIL